MDGRRMRWQVGIADCQPLRILKRSEWVSMQARQILMQKHVQILRAVHFYRFMTALDVATCVYTQTQLGKVRNVLADLCGGADFQGQVEDTCKKWSQGDFKWQRLRIERVRQVCHVDGEPAEAADMFSEIGAG